MEIGIDSFAKKTQTNDGGTVDDDAKAMSELIERIVHADKVGLDVFGLGEHHKKNSLIQHHIICMVQQLHQNCNININEIKCYYRF